MYDNNETAVMLVKLANPVDIIQLFSHECK